MRTTTARMGWDDHAPVGAVLPDGTTVRTSASDRWAVSARGWLFDGQDGAVGHYLDYGSDHYRSGHEYCRAECVCELSQPGHVHAVRCRTRTSRYFPTVADARRWIESTARPEGGAA